MKNGNKLLSLFLSAMLLFSLIVPAVALESDGEICSAVVQFEQGADADALCAALDALPGLRVKWRYNALFSGAAVEGSRAALALAGEQTGVETLALSRVWTAGEVFSDPAEPTNSLDLMNGLELTYDGDGIVVAVLDSGLRINHNAFRDYGIIDQPSIGEEDIDDFVANGGTDGRYISVKIPFAYDYSTEDRSVHTSDTHGTHVSALAVGYAVDGDGQVIFRGAAPAAQLLGMKVFPDDASLGADDADILKAMEDAYLLGADVINLSLGMPNGFVGDDQIGAVYRASLAVLEEAGVVVCCAVGNESMSLTGKTGDSALPTGSYTDYGTASAPAVYEGANAIAAVNAAFYEAGGGIMVGGQTIRYNKAVSDLEGFIPPAIEELADRTMDYVVIGGLGTAEDFAGLDLTGCAAVVQRGEIYFSQKVNNAAAAGAELCIIYNNEPGNILPAFTEETAIPCVMITQEDGAFLVEQANGARGTLTVAPQRTRISMGEERTMLPQSSWGATALQLIPTLAAPGGVILSASSNADDSYTYLSGTSMATPNASGAYAVVLQALCERGIEDKRERAELARALLESTAAQITDANGVPLSPRQQGAGVIDLSAALESGAVIANPLLELGESTKGWFTLRFTVKNLSAEKLTFSWNATVLTDAYRYSAGSWRSTLSPLDITERTVVVGAPHFSVLAGEERMVELNLRVDAALMDELSEIYPNGFYTEGYLTLTDQTGREIHATFLGYCGDWEKAPILEQVDFRDVMDAWYEQEMGEDPQALSALIVDTGYNLVLLCDEKLHTDDALVPGENPHLVTRHSDARNMMASVESDGYVIGGTSLVIDLFTLRNAEHVIMAVVDSKTGKLYYVSDREYLFRSEYSATLGEVLPAERFVWNGTDASGEPLRDGTAVKVMFYAWLETEERIRNAYQANVPPLAETDDYRWLLNRRYSGYIEWEFPMVIDASSPEVACRVDSTGEKVVIDVSDKQFVAYVSVRDRGGKSLAEEAFADVWAGERHRLTVASTDIAGQMLYITVVDYAGNTMGYEIDLSAAEPGKAVEAVQCPVAVLEDVAKDALYHEAVDFVIEEGLMLLENGAYFVPDGGVPRVRLLEMLYDLAGRPKVDAQSVVLPFSDVRGTEEFYPALLWAYSQGIVTGMSDAFFGAYMPVQRAQLAVMLMRAAQAHGEMTACEPSNFTDDTPNWAAEALSWAVEQGYLTPDAEGRIEPARQMTRVEFAYLLMNFYQTN